MPHLLTWPKRRTLRDTDGYNWTATIEPGSLVLDCRDGRTMTLHVTFADPDELRAFAMQVYAAAIEHDQAVQHAAAKASADRRQRRKLAGEPTGLRHRPFTDPPEPPAHMEVVA